MDKLTLDAILDEWKKDAVIDQTELAVESLKIPSLHHKYLRAYRVLRGKLITARNLYKQLVRDKHLYFTGAMDPEEVSSRGWAFQPLKILKQDVEIHLNADKDIIELSLKIGSLEERIDTLSDILKNINNRNFLIKNAIEWMRFTNGG